MKQLDSERNKKEEKVEKQQQIEEIIKEYSDNVRAIAKKYYISDGSEDDLYQEGLIGLTQGYNAYDVSRGEVGSPAFKSFVLMCAKRQIIDAVKRSKGKRNLPMEKFVSLSSDDFVETSGFADYIEESFEDKVINRLSEEEQTKVILNLSTFEQQVLELYLDDLKQSEIAEQLDKSVKSIDNTLQRIKNKLKRNK